MEYTAVELGGRMGNIAMKFENEEEAKEYVQLSLKTEKKYLETILERYNPSLSKEEATLHVEKLHDEKEVHLYRIDKSGVMVVMMTWYVFPLQKFITEYHFPKKDS